jgi:hypothetical protein
MVNQMDIEEEAANMAKSPVKTVSEELMTKTVILITKGIEMSQPRLIQRAVRQSVAMRKYITSSQVSRHILPKSPLTCRVVAATVAESWPFATQFA